MRKLGILLCVLALINVTACSMNKDNNYSKETEKTVIEGYTFTDDLGRDVIVNEPERVAALLGSFADVWVLAGGEVKASADDAWEDFDIDMAADAVNLGKTKEISLEKLFEAEPDFIMASTNTRVHMEWQETLEQTGIPTAYFDVADFDDYLRVLDICTDITGRKDLYEQNGLKVQEQIQTVVEQSKDRIGVYGVPKVLIVRVSAGMVVAKNSRDNVLGEMLHSLGCENIADSEDSLLEHLSMEYIMQEDPEYIFMIQVGDDQAAIDANFDQFIKENPAWKELTAIKEGKVYIMDKTLYNLKPNDRWGEAYENLETILKKGEQ